MKVRFYSLSKRSKSTMQPSGPYDEKEIQLKERCSVENPVLELTFEPVEYNYVYIPSWDRYYFVVNWNYINGIWEVSLSEDHLASFKTEIAHTTALILYAHGGSDDIVDSRIPVKSDVDVTTKSASLSDITWLSSGVGQPILAITGKGSNGIYAVNFYDMGELLDGFDSWYNDNIPDYWSAIKQLAYGGSAMDNIKGAFALPFTFSDGIAEDIYLGGYPAKKSNGTNISGKKLLAYNIDADVTVEIPWKYSDWRRSAPYSLIKIFLPLCGLFSINPEDVKNDSNLYVKYTFNRSSGDFSVKVQGATSGNVVVTSAGNCAMGLFVGSSGSDIGKITTGVGGGVASAVAGGAALAFGATGAAAVGAALAIGGGIAAAAGATISGLGGLTDGAAGLSGGATVNMGTDVKVFVVSKTLSDQPLNIAIRMGKPVFKNTKLSNYDGYIQTDGFQLASSKASISEAQTINNLVNSGIYLE